MTTSHFLNAPQQIRDLIFEYLLPSTTTIELDLPLTSITINERLEPLSQTCKQLREEVLCFYRTVRKDCGYTLTKRFIDLKLDEVHFSFSLIRNSVARPCEYVDNTQQGEFVPKFIDQPVVHVCKDLPCAPTALMSMYHWTEEDFAPVRRLSIFYHVSNQESVKGETWVSEALQFFNGKLGNLEELVICLGGEISDDLLRKYTSMWSQSTILALWMHMRAFLWGEPSCRGWSLWNPWREVIPPYSEVWMANRDGLQVPAQIGDVAGRARLCRSW